ncbi:MAG TPA: tetratricopeptide repeat protein, partial [Woeseiaceae bacterium]
EDLRIIGEQLNVDNVLEGSVRKSGPKLRITAQLIDTDNGYHLWSETYDRDLTDIFEIQDEIANNVVAALRVHLLGEQAATSAKGTASTEAYNLFLQGNYFLAHSSAENLKRSVDAYERAIALDPNFARAYAGLSFAVSQQVGGWTGLSIDGGFVEGYERVRGHAEKAYELAPDSPDALLAMSNAVLNADWDFAANARYNERALGIEPANTNLLEARGFDLLVLGRFEEAEALLTKATEIDPLSVTTHRALGDVQLAAGRFDDAIATYEHALRLSPESARLHERIARAYLFKGDVDAATKHAAEEPVAWVRELVEIMILRRRGDSDAWSRAVADYEARYGHANAYQLAEIYADAGDLDATFEWLSITAAVRDPGGIWGLRSPYFDAARQDPRWSEFRSAFKL